jgi:hypothetical protein
MPTPSIQSPPFKISCQNIRSLLQAMRQFNNPNNIVVCRVITMWWPQDRWMYQGHFCSKESTCNNRNPVGNEVFLCGQSRGVTRKTTGATKLVLYRSLWREDFSAWSWRISHVRSRCKGTAGEDTAGWKRISRCCGDL